MKLVKARVTNFRCVEDSGEFSIGSLTSLVGKNEAGKTAIMEALYGLRPFRSFEFDRVRDYPRRYLSKFDDRHEDGESIVVTTWWELSDADVEAVEDVFGEGVIVGSTVEIKAGIGIDGSRWKVPLDESRCVENLLTSHKLNASERSSIGSPKSTRETAAKLEAITGKTEKQAALLTAIRGFRNSSAYLAAIDILNERTPKFFYTSHFERMSGELSISKLKQDQQQGRVAPGDQIFLDFIQYAGTTLEELQQTDQFEELKAICEGASNDITDEIFEFWSQNEALAVKIELNEGRPGDPPPFNSGTVAKIRIENQNHRVTVPLSERSAGFVWFFSFLAQFKQLRKEAGSAILLLDEPGLTLHGKAQSDLLRYIDQRLLPDHQVIYTTHSPFMVPSDRLEDVRVVEDVVHRDDGGRVKVLGTKVSSDILSVDRDTLFPLQACLGYDITQSLFVGQNTLLVEGPSDILYLYVLSQALKKRGRESLDRRWTLCPSGGVDKVLSFASLFRGNNLNIAVFCDYGKGDKKAVARLKESEVLHASQIWTVPEFTGKHESDVEDLLAEDLYLAIVNSAFSLSGSDQLDSAKLAAVVPVSERLVKQVEGAFKTMPPETPEFDHFTPADWLFRNPDILDDDNAGVTDTLNRAEKVFTAINSVLA